MGEAKGLGSYARTRQSGWWGWRGWSGSVVTAGVSSSEFKRGGGGILRWGSTEKAKRRRGIACGDRSSARAHER